MHACRRELPIDIPVLALEQAAVGGPQVPVEEGIYKRVNERVCISQPQTCPLHPQRNANMLFNPKESIDFNGNTGPFIQYTYARINSVIRKAGDFNPEATPKAEPNQKESTLVQKVADFPSVVAEAGRNYSPAVIANYAYDLAKEYNQFYHDYSILREENKEVRDLRLLISFVVARTLKSAMALLGIEMPERM